ncbi:hypothetical protein BZA77DRAFT_317656 [Pyronema omphalodes]|nr:hypothetical protein BZA77DRAFT_317656 [Pyronema omphalodes]
MRSNHRISVLQPLLGEILEGSVIFYGMVWYGMGVCSLLVYRLYIDYTYWYIQVCIQVCIQMMGFGVMY